MMTEDKNNPQTEEENSQYFPCGFCSFSTEDIEALDEHIVLAHEDKYFEDGEEDKKGNIQYSIVDDDDLEDVKPTHLDTQKNHRTRSYSLDSNDEIPNLKKSRIIDHDFQNADSIYICPFCDLKTTKRNFMPAHIRDEHRGGDTVTYQCSECTYTTRRKCDMPKHLLTHCDETTTIMHQCPFCNYQTKRKTDLPKHLLCHKKGTQMFTCPHCQYSTKRQSDLVKHSQVHRGVNAKSGIATRTSFGGTLHNCIECGYSANRLRDLMIHVLVHSEEPYKDVYKCRKCVYCTSHRSSFARHIINRCESCENPIEIVEANEEDFNEKSSQSYVLAMEETENADLMVISHVEQEVEEFTVSEEVTISP